MSALPLLSILIGLPLLGYLREKHPELPVVVLSGQAAPRVLPEGIEAWYHKPYVSAARLKEIVQTHAKGLLE